ncbi:MAG: flippase-like domain-containing protein [Chloroflexota bacterium]|nr:flippase-like domain-containing protein [Chloroflexota bacterium]MDQ5864332.1 flippase-like domain-containing protein [Chloroflexota bacterium]
MFRSRRFIIGLVISLVFLAWALSQEDLGKVFATIGGMNWVSLVPALALYFLGVGVRAVRWRILLRPLLPNLSLFKTFEVVVIGYMANNLLPARIGELVRAYVLNKREGVRKTSTLATIVVERIFDALVMVGFVAAALLFVIFFHSELLSTGEGHKFGTFITDWSPYIALFAVGFLAFLVLFVVIASSQRRVEVLINFGLRFVPGKLHDRVKRLANAFVLGLGSLRSIINMLLVFALSIVAWLLEAGMYYVIGSWGFNLVGSDGTLVPFYAYVLTTGIVNLSTLIPQAAGYWGVFEAICKVVLVGAIGVDSGLTTSYVLLLHAALYFPVTLLGVVFLARESLSWRELTDLEKQRAEASDAAHELEGPVTDVELAQEGKLPDHGADRPQPNAPAEGDDQQQGLANLDKER